MNGQGVLVTGGTSGLGAETCRRFAALGASVVVAGRNVEAGKTLADQIGGRYVRCDVTDEESVAGAVEAAAAAVGGLRLAVSAAGIAAVAKTVGRDGSPHPIESFRQLIDVNLVGAFNLLRLSASAMTGNEPNEDGSRGAIVLTSSVGAYEGQMGQVAYAASKGGVVAMVLPAARDLARSGIRVAGIAPGVFDTPFMDILSAEAKAGIAASIPHPSRLGRASEYAALVQHIAENPMLNGETIRLDGALRLGMK
ncbi:SDR family NAD(P)-dependent oxidoreductase [Kribbella sp. NPDC055071]